MRFLIFCLSLLFSLQVQSQQEIIPLDFSPFPLSGGDMNAYVGLWDGETSLIELKIAEKTYWDLPMLQYREKDHLTGEVLKGFAWSAHSKLHYWLYVPGKEGAGILKRLYFGVLAKPYKLFKECGNMEQIKAIMILDEEDSLEVPEYDHLHIEAKKGRCQP